jgi:hypothetical protein
MSRPRFQPFITGATSNRAAQNAHGPHERAPDRESTEALLGLRHASNPFPPSTSRCLVRFLLERVKHVDSDGAVFHAVAGTSISPRCRAIGWKSPSLRSSGLRFLMHQVPISRSMVLRTVMPRLCKDRKLRPLRPQSRRQPLAQSRSGAADSRLLEPPARSPGLAIPQEITTGKRDPGAHTAWTTSAASASAMPAGVPTCIHTPSRRRPCSRPASSARLNSRVSENGRDGASANRAGDKIAVPA